jgi:hypothetical protein
MADQARVLPQGVQVCKMVIPECEWERVKFEPQQVEAVPEEIWRIFVDDPNALQALSVPHPGEKRIFNIGRWKIEDIDYRPFLSEPPSLV